MREIFLLGHTNWELPETLQKLDEEGRGRGRDSREEEEWSDGELLLHLLRVWRRFGSLAGSQGGGD